ncbi:uncharacterized protein LOC135218741 [Macrobrachium nipponense]|uniref:uncharacterized protein LOC135218741 n=1 Tax=Macrobrachium nipponense TaxID=159736 RepID=UPI0030C7A250
MPAARPRTLGGNACPPVPGCSADACPPPVARVGRSADACPPVPGRSADACPPVPGRSADACPPVPGRSADACPPVPDARRRWPVRPGTLGGRLPARPGTLGGRLSTEASAVFTCSPPFVFISPGGSSNQRPFSPSFLAAIQPHHPSGRSIRPGHRPSSSATPGDHFLPLEGMPARSS